MSKLETRFELAVKRKLGSKSKVLIKPVLNVLHSAQFFTAAGALEDSRAGQTSIRLLFTATRSIFDLLYRYCR